MHYFMYFDVINQFHIAQMTQLEKDRNPQFEINKEGRY